MHGKPDQKPPPKPPQTLPQKTPTRILLDPQVESELKNKFINKTCRRLKKMSRFFIAIGYRCGPGLSVISCW